MEKTNETVWRHVTLRLILVLCGCGGQSEDHDAPEPVSPAFTAEAALDKDSVSLPEAEPLGSPQPATDIQSEPLTIAACCFALAIFESRIATRHCLIELL